MLNYSESPIRAAIVNGFRSLTRPYASSSALKLISKPVKNLN
jgi:hypothetical protein